MAKYSIIIFGCRVKGKYVPLKSNPNPKFKRHIFEIAVGTVVCADKCHK